METFLSLNPTWDRQIKIHRAAGNHVIRKHEHEMLVDFISRREEGSLLVCGNRGVGKTSSVIKAINTVDTTHNKIIVVKIDATTESSFIKELVGALYKTVRDIGELSNEIKDKISELYAISEAAKTSKEKAVIKRTTSEKILNIKFNVPGLIALITMSLLGITVPDLIPPLFSLSFFLAYGIAMSLISVFYRRQSSKRETASYYYQYNYTDAKIQSSLMAILSRLQEHKILFVIDELDKVPNPLEKIKSIKTLINQGSALYIFISDPAILEQLTNKKNKEYTLFSQKLFFKRPSFEEMDKFLDGIVCWDGGANNDEEKQQYQDFMNYISYVSHTDFFEIYNAIRNHTIVNDKKQLLLNIIVDDEKTGKARLQKAIRWVYQRRQIQNPSRWQDNDKMLEFLYMMTERLENSAINSSITIDGNAFKFSRGDDILYDDFTRKAIDDLYYYFIKVGYLRKKDDNRFTLSGNLSQVDPDKEGIFVAEQRKFMAEYQNFIHLSVRYGNICNKWINNRTPIFNFETHNAKWPELVTVLNPIVDISRLENHKNSFVNIESGVVHAYQTEILQSMTEDVSSTNDSFVENSSYLLSLIIEKQVQVGSIGRFGTLADSGMFRQMDGSKTFPNIIIPFDKNGTRLLVVMLINQADSETISHLLSQDLEFGLLVICVRSNLHTKKWNKIHKIGSDMREMIKNDFDRNSTRKMYLASTPLCTKEIASVVNALKSLNNFLQT